MIYLTPNVPTPEQEVKLKPLGAFTKGLAYPVIAVLQQPNFVVFYIPDDNGKVISMLLDRLQKEDLFRVDLRQPDQMPVSAVQPPKGPVATPEVVIEATPETIQGPIIDTSQPPPNVS
jgi:hypothetical protein